MGKVQSIEKHAWSEAMSTDFWCIYGCFNALDISQISKNDLFYSTPEDKFGLLLGKLWCEIHIYVMSMANEPCVLSLKLLSCMKENGERTEDNQNKIFRYPLVWSNLFRSKKSGPVLYSMKKYVYFTKRSGALVWIGDECLVALNIKHLLDLTILSQVD